jgi:peptide/nickel transport system substrate-binding protein
VRQAVAHAVNAQEIIDEVLSGQADRNFGLMPTGIFAYDPAIEEFGYAYDPDQAAALLEEAGWVDENDDGVREKDGNDLELVFWTFSDPAGERVIQVIQNQLGEVGIKANIEILEIGTLIATMPENAWDLMYISVGWPEADILNVMAFDLPAGISYYRKPEYIDLLTQARQTSDLDERKRLYFEAQQIALADAVIVPLWTTLASWATRNEVQGYKLGPENISVWVDAWVED